MTKVGQTHRHKFRVEAQPGGTTMQRIEQLPSARLQDYRARIIRLRRFFGLKLVLGGVMTCAVLGSSAVNADEFDSGYDPLAVNASAVAAPPLDAGYPQPMAAYGPPPSRMPAFGNEVPDLVDHPHDLKLVQVKVGAVFPVGGGTYGDRLDTGFGFDLSRRMLFDYPDDGQIWFFELGVDYAGQNSSGRPVVVNAAVGTTNPINNAVINPTQIVPDAVSVQLNELHRAGLHAAFGTTVTPGWLESRMPTPINFTARAGFRLGHARAFFEQNPTPPLAAAIAGNPNLQFNVDAELENSDVYWGLLGSLGAGSAYTPMYLSHWYLGEISWGAELEYRYDWFDLGEFDADASGVGSLTTWFTCTIAR